MKNLKVSTKLVVSFMIVLVLAIVVGLIGIIGMGQLNTGEHELYHGNYQPTVLAADLSKNVVEERTYIRSFIIYNSDEDGFKSAEKSLSESRAQTDTLLTEYKATITNPQDQTTYDEFIKVYKNEWTPFVDNIYKLGKENNNEEAEAVLGTGSAMVATLDTLSVKLQEINLSDGEKTLTDNGKIYQLLTWVGIGVLILAAAVSIFLSIYISGLISKPLKDMMGYIKQAGETGNLLFRSDEWAHCDDLSKGKDEIGQTMKAFTQMMRKFVYYGELLDQVAHSDLTVTPDTLGPKDTFGVAITQMVDNLNSMFEEINSSSSQVSVGSHQVADGAQALASGSTEQAASVQQLSSSIAEIAAHTKENAVKAEQAAKLAETIKSSAEKGSGQMDEMMKSVKDINEASQSISKVIKTIDDIAFQTNILALNAAVEAARAGQHGKGFAVVAEEVRNLAAKSAEAAKDTEGLIADSMQKAEQGVHIAGETAASLSDIVSGINQSDVLINEIARASEEQSLSISQVNTGIDQVAKVVQQNSATAQESAAASQEMSSQSAVLQDLISQFKLKNDTAPRRISAKAAPRRIAAPESDDFAFNGDDAEFGKY